MPGWGCGSFQHDRPLGSGLELTPFQDTFSLPCSPPSAAASGLCRPCPSVALEEERPQYDYHHRDCSTAAGASALYSKWAAADSLGCGHPPPPKRMRPALATWPLLRSSSSSEPAAGLSTHAPYFATAEQQLQASGSCGGGHYGDEGDDYYVDNGQLPAAAAAAAGGGAYHTGGAAAWLPPSCVSQASWRGHAAAAAAPPSAWQQQQQQRSGVVACPYIPSYSSSPAAPLQYAEAPAELAQLPSYLRMAATAPTTAARSGHLSDGQLPSAAPHCCGCPAAAPPSPSPLPALAAPAPQQQQPLHRLCGAKRARAPSPVPEPCAGAPPQQQLRGEDCIAHAAKLLSLEQPQALRLAQHCWRRIEGRLQWGHPRAAAVATGCALACLRLGLKLEACRKEVPGAAEVGALVGLSAAQLGSVELSVLRLLDWSPYAGYDFQEHDDLLVFM